MVQNLEELLLLNGLLQLLDLDMLLTAFRHVVHTDIPALLARIMVCVDAFVSCLVVYTVEGNEQLDGDKACSTMPTLAMNIHLPALSRASYQFVHKHNSRLLFCHVKVIDWEMDKIYCFSRFFNESRIFSLVIFMIPFSSQAHECVNTCI